MKGVPYAAGEDPVRLHQHSRVQNHKNLHLPQDHERRKTRQNSMSKLDNQSFGMSENRTSTKKFQKFLDNDLYEKHKVLRFEQIYGRTWVSTGGQGTTAEFFNELDLKVMKNNYTLHATIYAVSSPTCLLRELDGDRTLRCCSSHNLFV